MIVDTNQRCMIWYGEPSRRERDLLAAAGWRLRTADPARDPRVGMRRGDQVIGLMDLRGDADARAAMARLVADLSDLPLVALAPDDLEIDDPVVRHVLQSCSERLACPLDQDSLLRALSTSTQEPAASRLDDMLGESPPMLDIRAAIQRFSRVDLPVLVTGETGTGKELAARALHALSSRADRPFVAVNCGALPANLVQAELFGHERGAFTGANTRRVGLFESADGGTVFLDEIGDLPADAQTTLLRVLQEGTLERIGSNRPVKIDVRVLAATHVDLEQAVAQGRFREDLFYRLDVLPLHMPPLRARGDDVNLMARQFLENFRDDHGLRARGFSAQARTAMQTHAWPGNVRELMNRVRRAAVIAEGDLIEPADLQLDAVKGIHNDLAQKRFGAERDALLKTLRETGFNVSACARRLNISRVTVYRLCKKHQLELQAMR